MIRFLLSNPLTRWLGGALAALLAVLGYGALKKREGRQEAREAARQAQDDKAKEARNAAQDEREATDGLSDSDIVDRLRRRDGDWGRM